MANAETPTKMMLTGFEIALAGIAVNVISSETFWELAGVGAVAVGLGFIVLGAYNESRGYPFGR